MKRKKIIIPTKSGKRKVVDSKTVVKKILLLDEENNIMFNQITYTIADGSTVSLDFTQANVVNGVSVSPTTVSKATVRLTDGSTVQVFPVEGTTPTPTPTPNPALVLPTEIDLKFASGQTAVYTGGASSNQSNSSNSNQPQTAQTKVEIGQTRNVTGLAQNSDGNFVDSNGWTYSAQGVRLS